MNKFNFNRQLMRLIVKDLLERMLAVAAMILMFMFRLEQVLISVAKNQHLLRASRASQAALV
jgi:hypothetical protein